jgi:hypothetical protein
MWWLLVPLGVAFLLLIDTEHRAWYALTGRGERVAARAHARALQRRRERSLEWINEWRVAHGRVRLRELRKGVPGSRSYGIIARNLEVLSYADGEWLDANGGGGAVPDFVAEFARDFDDGLFGDIVGRLVSAPAPARGGAHCLPWRESAVVA